MKLKRRNLLRFLSLTGLAPLMGFQWNPQEECLTTPDIEGPFYIPGAPITPQLAPEGAQGTPLMITGTVYANDCMTPIPEALVDVWHASDAGDYEDVNYRGKVNADEHGQYSYSTVLPGKYLNGSYFRPRHLHYKISSEETELTTQIYFEGDDSIPIDPWASDPAAEERIIPLTEDQQGNLHGVADIVLDVMPIINSSQEPRKSPKNSGIQSIQPNPLKDTGVISIYLNKSGNIRLSLLNLNGKQISQPVADQYFKQGFHQFPINANNNLGIKAPAGVYILQLHLNKQLFSAQRLVIL